MANEAKAPHPHRLERYIRYALIIFAVVLLALVIFFVAQYESLRRAQLINARHFEMSQLLAHHAPLPTSDAAVVVRSWMTFQYLNKIFALPTNYLQMQLEIANSHYPRLTIASYAAGAGLNEASVVSQVDAAIGQFVVTSTATSTAGTSSTQRI